MDPAGAGSPSGSHGVHGSPAAARRKLAQTQHADAISQSGIAPPLDFSFQEISNLAGDAKRVAPTAIVTGVRLAYNELTNLTGLVGALEQLLGPDARTQLTWLDLSHNRLSSVDEALLHFPNLTSLYLHGNQISSIHEVRKLHPLSRLAKLTLHGNPLYVEKQNHGLKQPRSAVVHHLRNCPLKSLDFITITDHDRRNAMRWAESNKTKKRPEATGGGAAAATAGR